MLCISFFTLGQDAPPPLVSMDISKYSKSKLVTSVEFYKATSLLTLICLYGCCSLLGVVRIKRTIQKGDFLYVVGNTHIILVFAQPTVSMEVNSQIEVTL